MRLNKTSLIVLLFIIKTAHGAGLLQALESMEQVLPGCPANSICTPSAGARLLKWEKLVNKVDSNKVSSKNKIIQLEKFIKKNGLPVEFLTTINSKIPLDPILWNSRCRLHNPKNTHKNIYKGLYFTKKIKYTEHSIFATIWLYDGSKKTTYNIPYQDQVLFIQNDQLVVLKEYDDFYYQVAISKDGNFRITNFPHSLISKALTVQVKEFKCPDKVEFDKKYFAKTYCKRVLDLDTNQLKTIQYPWSCP